MELHRYRVDFEVFVYKFVLPGQDIVFAPLFPLYEHTDILLREAFLRQVPILNRFEHSLLLANYFIVNYFIEQRQYLLLQKFEIKQ